MEGASHLVSTLGQLVGKEYRQLRAVSGQVAELSDELASMKAILRMQSEADDGTVDHFLREWMKQVRDLAYDAEDCVDVYIFRIRCRLRELGFVAWSKRQLATVATRRRLAGEIKALSARAVTISERHVRYSHRVSSRETLVFAPPVWMPYMHNLYNNRCHEFVGDQYIRLEAMIKGRRYDEDPTKLKVFSIVGFGGIGKTALAMEVCRRVEAEFQLQAHVSVSPTFSASKDLKPLLESVLLQMVAVSPSLTLDMISGMSVDQLADTLNDRLQDKRYLIVIDDVWTVPAWDAIQSKLPINHCGSIILMTTRMETVAKACSHGSVSGDDIYYMRPLNSDDAGRLFLRFLRIASFSTEINEEEVRESILRKCSGLPIAIVTIAGLLSGYKLPESRKTWEAISRSIGSHMESYPSVEGIRQILTVCYNHLPHYLKGCVMYLSIFPQNYIISKDRLLMGWIAEGLVEERMRFTLLEVAEQYLEELVSRGMMGVVQNEVVTTTDGKNTDLFRVHDMMLDVIASKSLEVNFVSIVGGEYAGRSYHRVRRLAIHDGGLQQGASGGRKNKAKAKAKSSGPGNYSSSIEGMNLKYVRSLSMFDIEGHKLLNRLGEFTLLRVLDLEDCKALENNHMGAICRMYLLKVMRLKGTDISMMPREVGDLEHLQSLDVYQTRLTGLPETVKKLKKVECLKFSNKDEWVTMWKAPVGVSEMKALREVDKVVVDNVLVAQEIGDLEQLQRLDVYVDGESEHTDEVRGALACSLCKTCSLHSLTVGDTTFYTLDYLIDLPSPPQLLRYLKFSGCISRLPDWIGSLIFLVEIVVEWTQLQGDQLLGVLCKAPSLQSVQFDIGAHRDNELVARTSHNFRALTVMRVLTSSVGADVFRFEEGSMTKLETLEVNFGDKEKRIVGIEHLTSLKRVQLSGEEGNPALQHSVEEMKEERDRRPEANQFTVGVRIKAKGTSINY